VPVDGRRRDLIREFGSLIIIEDALLAQLVERLTSNHEVASSNLAQGLYLLPATYIW
jgi:hypothetical protein